MRISQITAFLFLLIIISESALADTFTQDTTYIFLKDYGLYKTKDKNAIKYINKALEDVKGDQPKVLVFSPGEYHFYPEDAQTREYFESNTTDINPKVCAFLFENISNLVIDGRGSQLIFHEQMQPFTFDHCNNITLKNISIDWEQPLTAQAEILKATKHFIEVGIDEKQYPFSIEDGKLYFNENHRERKEWRSTMEFDRKGRFIVPQTGDNGCLGENWQYYEAVATMPGIFRLMNNFERQPAKGNYLVFRYNERTHAGIFITDSKNVQVQNLNLYYAAGLGILAQFSENLTFEGYRAIPNPTKNRYFGGGDDGIQISNCKGQVIIRDCEFAGLMDDPVNVHGTSVQVQTIIAPNKLRCRFMHEQSVGLNWGHKGDQVSFIENEEMYSLGFGAVTNFQMDGTKNFILTLKNPIPATLKEGDALENLSWSPDVLIENNLFKSCRARGLLVSTPGKVVIQNNVFESSGSAILISGDANGWFESGAVRDVLIQGNKFNDLCNTSSYQFCEAIISVYPIIPKLEDNAPAFHRNIRIIGNEFHPFDYPVLFARSVDGISFEKNKLTRSFNFEPFHERHYTFTFEYCKQVRILDNEFSEDLLGKNILLKRTPDEQLISDLENQFLIERF